MVVKIKNIVGALVEKKVILNIKDRRQCLGYAIDLIEIRDSELQDDGRKWLITKIANFLDEIANKFTPVSQQGEVQITLSRERLAKIIYEDMREGFFKFLHPINDYPDWENADERWRTTAYRQADAILKERPTLLETVKPNKGEI